MAEPALVGDCVAAMKAAVTIPVTVKCRIGIDDQDPEVALDAFAGAVEAAGADALIVHARKAWLKGLSPRENRDIPPLDYDVVFRLKAAHPELPDRAQWRHRRASRRRASISHKLDGVMMGRAAYQEPWRLLQRRSAAVRRSGAVCIAEGRGAGADPLYRARAVARHAAACHHPPSARPVPCRAGRARIPPASGDRGGQARRMRRGSGRGAGAGGGQARRTGANRRGLSRSGNQCCSGCRSASLCCSPRPWWSRGIVTGILAGLFGIGGGAIIVPVLYEVFRILGVPEEVRMQLCVGTSMAIIVPTTIRSYLTHRAKGAVLTM